MTKPIGYGFDEDDERIPMTQINSVSDFIAHIGIADNRPTHVAVYEMAKITGWIKSAWNRGRTVGYKEAYDAIKEQTLRAELDEKRNEMEAFKVRCSKILASSRRSSRKRY